MKRQSDFQSVLDAGTSSSSPRGRSPMLQFTNPKTKAEPGLWPRGWGLCLLGWAPQGQSLSDLTSAAWPRLPSVALSHPAKVGTSHWEPWGETIPQLLWVWGSNNPAFPGMAADQGVWWTLGLESLTSCCLSKDSCGSIISCSSCSSQHLQVCYTMLSLKPLEFLAFAL